MSVDTNNRYSDKDLAEFKDLIQEKIKKANISNPGVALLPRFLSSKLVKVKLMSALLLILCKNSNI